MLFTCALCWSYNALQSAPTHEGEFTENGLGLKSERPFLHYFRKPFDNIKKKSYFTGRK
jgi:hypothetical protein